MAGTWTVAGESLAGYRVRERLAPGDGGRAARRLASTESSSAAALQLSRARTVASSLDLRGARVDEALDALGRYLDDAALAGLDRVTIIHGLGTGAVRAQASDHPQVKGVRAGERGEGGDGATVLSL